jgi:thioesterase domain-containing protein
VAAVAPKRRLAWIFERARDEHLLAPDMDLSLFERRLAVFRANVRAMREYPVRPYGGEVVLFSPAEAPAGAAEAWRDALPLLRIEPVGGNHLTLVREPHVALLAERLKSHLREASGANAP